MTGFDAQLRHLRDMCSQFEVALVVTRMGWTSAILSAFSSDQSVSVLLLPSSDVLNCDLSHPEQTSAIRHLRHWLA